MFWLILFFLAGGGSLYLGAEALVRGASRIARALDISPMLIGIVIVGIGTSLPEMVISTVASLEGQPAVTAGNILGSNVANIGLILGLAATLAPVPAPRMLVRREVPFLLAVTGFFYVLSWRGRIDRVDAILFLAGLVWFLRSVVHWARQDSPVAVEIRRAAFREYRQHFDSVRDVTLVVAGIAGLVLGGHLLVLAVVDLARRSGLSELVISASIVAVGGSLPELVTSLVAARRARSELLLGNLVGSNVFNILGAMGLASLARPVTLHASPVGIEFLAMLVFTAALPVVLRRGERVSRIEGTWLLAGYCIFVVLLYAS
jgi:cation:H+ antiporter